MLSREGSLQRDSLTRDRLRFRPLTRADWAWSIGTLAAIGLMAAGGLVVIERVYGDVPVGPSFTHLEPLTPDRYQILVVWLAFFLLNILSAEILWRGVVLPRKETAFGPYAWLVNGVEWLLFRLPFGFVICVMIAPITLILPRIVQYRRNSSIGVVVHAGLNGVGFLATAFGAV